MLSFLHMRDFALIDNLSLEFYPGLNVLTGETGAGKSILIGAINLLLGERASSEHVRTGAEQTLIEAVFTVSPAYEELQNILEAQGLTFQEEIVISREISRSGRNICRINGRIVPLTALKSVGSALVDLHGQHSHQSLLRPEQHLFLLDEFGGEELLNTKRKLEGLFDRWLKVKRQLKDRGTTPQERAGHLELLSYQLEEITKANLTVGEEESLKQRLLLLNNLEKLLTTAEKAYVQIYGGGIYASSILDQLHSIKEEISALLKADTRLEPFIKVLQDVCTQLSELGHELYNYKDKLFFSREEVLEIENRLELYRRLKAKYGSSVEEILSFAQKCSQEIELLEKSEAEALALQKNAENLARNIEQVAGHLTAKRMETARILEGQVQEVLKELGMENACFSVSFMAKKAPERKGNEDLEFLFTANAGEPLKPLARIISAGEMARVMLALKSILAEQDYIPTLIFDEIDSGIGGLTIQKVAEKMSRLSAKHQVICVTHSAHIASAANHHYFIFKETLKGRTSTRVNYLQEEKRVLEIARMLNGGDISTITRRHAEELFKRGQKK